MKGFRRAIVSKCSDIP